jgi:hypothetical protein
MEDLTPTRRVRKLGEHPAVAEMEDPDNRSEIVVHVNML